MTDSEYIGKVLDFHFGVRWREEPQEEDLAEVLAVMVEALGERTAELRERVRWLEEGLKAVEAVVVVHPATSSGRDAYADPYDVRRLVRHYLKREEK